MTVRILGIDPGTLRLGYGLVDVAGSRTRLVIAGTCGAPRSQAVARRLGSLQSQVETIIGTHAPSCIAMESSFHGRNAQAMLRLGEARGLILGIAARHDLEVHDYSPASIKKAVTGKGSAGKEAVARMVIALLDARRTASATTVHHDATDALAVALCHAHRLSAGPKSRDHGALEGRGDAVDNR